MNFRPGKFLMMILIICLLSATHLGCAPQNTQEPKTNMKDKIIKLPEPKMEGETFLEEALNERESVRNFANEELSLEQISQLLWAAHGRTLDAISSATRNAPSAGALHPLEIYILMKDGVYHHDVENHVLNEIMDEDKRLELADAALGQSSIKDAPMNVVITAVYERTTAKYGERAVRYVHLEAGHAAQNILLQATSMGLGGVPIGAFHDDEVKEVLSLPQDYEPLYIVPIGYPAE